MAAVLLSAPESTSAWVGVWVAVQIICSPGARTSAGHDSSEVSESSMLIPVTSTLPMFDTTIEYSTGVLVLNAVALADLTTRSRGTAVTSVTAKSPDLMTSSEGSLPEATAPFVTVPRRMSAWTMVYLAEQLVESPGSSLDSVHTTGSTSGSETATSVRVTLPLLVTVKL